MLVQKMNYVDLLTAQLDAAAALALSTIVPTAQQAQRKQNKKYRKARGRELLENAFLWNVVWRPG